MSVPSSCPMCGSAIKWIKVDEQREGLSIGKAIVGKLLFGNTGLIGGALIGHKTVTMCCGKCGFKHAYKK